jgi:thiol-disulfide isomerase/thioredoxin
MPLEAGDTIAPRNGEVVVVAFYGTWCPAARKMLRSVADLSKSSSGRGLAVVSVAEQEDAADAERFAQSVGLEGPVTVDAKGELARRFGLDTVPALVLIGRDGVVRRVHAGFHEDTAEAVGREVTALLTAPRTRQQGGAVDAIATRSER